MDLDVVSEVMTVALFGLFFCFAAVVVAAIVAVDVMVVAKALGYGLSFCFAAAAVTAAIKSETVVLANL